GLTDRACKVDDDCTNFAELCGCAQAVSKAALPKLQAMKEKEVSLDCLRKGPPRPCATCPPPPPRHCESGGCQWPRPRRPAPPPRNRGHARGVSPDAEPAH